MVMQAGDQLTQLLNLQRLPVGNTVLLAIGNDLVQVATVAQQVCSDTWRSLRRCAQ